MAIDVREYGKSDQEVFLGRIAKKLAGIFQKV
jgi:hypothetical protein